MATKKTPSNKSLKQLAESLPPAYELHRSGGEFIMEEVLDIGGNKTGKTAKKRVSQEVLDLPKEKRHEHESVPKDFIVTTEGYLWKPHIYRMQVNHYRRLRNAYSLKGMAGVTEYLQEIRKSQLERKARLEKEKEADPTGDKLFGNEEKPNTVVASSHGLFGDKELNKEVTNSDTLGDG